MPEALILEFTGVTEAEYEAVNKQLGIDMHTGEGEWPAGLLSHAAGPADDPDEPSSKFQGFFVTPPNQWSPIASSPRVRARVGTPATATCPSASTRSWARASSRSAASFRTCSRTVSAAFASALPASWIEREPEVPSPRGTRAVSASTTSTRSRGRPSLSATIWA